MFIKKCFGAQISILIFITLLAVHPVGAQTPSASERSTADLESHCATGDPSRSLSSVCGTYISALFLDAWEIERACVALSA